MWRSGPVILMTGAWLFSTVAALCFFLELQSARIQLLGMTCSREYWYVRATALETILHAWGEHPKPVPLGADAKVAEVVR